MQAQRLKISGMTCGGCVSKVAHALEAITGVKKVAVSLTNGEAEVQYDDEVTSIKQLGAAVRTAGFTVSDSDTPMNPKNSGGCCGGSS